jgi:hypothetical protein
MDFGPNHFKFSEWLAHEVEKISTRSALLGPEDRETYLRVQIAVAIRHAFRHGRSGRSEDDPVID